MINRNFLITNLIFLLSICSFSCLAQSIDTTKLYSYVVEKKRVVFYSGSIALPFTIYFRPAEWFLPEDIFESFYEYYYDDPYLPIFPPFEKAGIPTQLSYKKVSSIDTVFNYFTQGFNINQFCKDSLRSNEYFEGMSESDVLRLEYELFYSLLLKMAIQPRLNDIHDKEIIRIILPKGFRGTKFTQFTIFTIILTDQQNAVVEIIRINTKQIKNIFIEQHDTILLSKRAIKELHYSLNRIDLDMARKIPNASVPIYSVPDPYCLEYNKNGNYYHYIKFEYFLKDSNLRKQIVRLNYLCLVIESLIDKAR